MAASAAAPGRPVQRVCSGSALFLLAQLVREAGRDAEAIQESPFSVRFSATPGSDGTQRFDLSDRWSKLSGTALSLPYRPRFACTVWPGRREPRQVRAAR